MTMDDNEHATDEYGLCTLCGGHGATFRHAESDEFTERERRRVQRGGPWPLRSVPCMFCDGRDRVTPIMEARAEAAR